MAAKRSIALFLCLLLSGHDVSVAVLSVPPAASMGPPVSLITTEAVTPGLLLRLHSFQEKLSYGIDGWLGWFWRHPRTAIAASSVVTFALSHLKLMPIVHGVALGSLLAGVFATQPPDDPQKTLREAIDAHRALLFGENADAVEAALLAEARRTNRPFLRLTLAEDDDLDRFWERFKIVNGKPFSDPGPLTDLLRRNGILMIDYPGSRSKLVVSLHSLFDSHPYLKDIAADGKKLSIVGFLPLEANDPYASAYYDRFDFEAPIKLPYKDPVADLPRITRKLAPLKQPVQFFPASPDHALPGDYIHVSLKQSPHFQEILFENAVPEHGLLTLVEGALVDAARRDVPIVIAGASWANPALAHALRERLLYGGVDHNGTFYPFGQNFQIYLAAEDYKTEPACKILLGAGEGSAGRPAYVVNKQTQDLLFGRSMVENSRMTQREGLLLERGVRLRITESLPGWVWNRIMHEAVDAEVEVAAGVPVRADYRARRSDKLKKARVQTATISWESAKLKPVVVIESNDASFVRAHIQKDLAARMVVPYHVTPDTSLEDLISAFELDGLSGDIQLFAVRSKEIFRSFERDVVFVLDGMESNPDLARQLQTLFTEDPYVMHNSGRQPLTKARFVLITKPNVEPLAMAPARVAMPSTNEAIRNLLAAEFGEIFQDGDFERLKHLHSLFINLKPEQPGQFPDQLNWSYERLRLLYLYRREGMNWLDAFENVLFSNYLGDPEVAAYMRVIVRVLFQVTEAESGRRRGSVQGRALKRYLNQLVPGVQDEKFFWQLADTLSLDLLTQAEPGESFENPSVLGVHRLVNRALVKNMKRRRADVYRDRFSIAIGEDLSDAPAIDWGSRIGELTWDALVDRILNAYKVRRGVMLKGAPGTGKSHIVEEVRKELGYGADEVFGPATAGPDVTQADMVARRIPTRDDKMETWLGPAGKWAKRREGGFLWVDEANLTDPAAFWNFLRGLAAKEPYMWVDGERVALTDRHKFIFTGNGETLPGRQFQELIEELMITVPFPPFKKSFLSKLLKEKYIPARKPQRTRIIPMALELHTLFKQMGPHLGFSPRNLQELANRINALGPQPWPDLRDQVIYTAWALYRGSFTLEERLALQSLIRQRYGVDLHQLELRKTEEIRRQKQEAFFKPGDPDGIVIVDTNARIIETVTELVHSRARRIKGRTDALGKLGVLLEGASGLVKDVATDKTLASMGFHEARTVKPEDDIPADRIYHHIQVTPDVTHLIETVEEARTKGQIVVISEPNLLDSGFLEGILKDFLTGGAAPGFAVILTMNTLDFRGLNRFSTALIDRLVYERVYDYPERELTQIAQEYWGRLYGEAGPQEDLQHLVKAHVWLRGQLRDASRHPTPRRLLRALRRRHDRGGPMDEALRASYGTIYLDRFLGGRSFPARSELLNRPELRSFDETGMLEKIIRFVVPSASPVQVKRHGRVDGGRVPAIFSWQDKQGDISVSLPDESFTDGSWEEELYDAAAKGMFNRELPDSLPGIRTGADLALALSADEDAHEDFGEAIRELADYQNMATIAHDLSRARERNAFALHFPHSGQEALSEAELIMLSIVRHGRLGDLIMWLSGGYSLGRLSLTQTFQLIMVVYAKLPNIYGATPEQLAQEQANFREQLQRMEELVQKMGVGMSKYFPENPFRLARVNLDLAQAIVNAVPRTLEEEEIKVQAGRAAQVLKELRPAARRLQQAMKDKDFYRQAPPIPEKDRQTLDLSRMDPHAPALAAQDPAEDERHAESVLEEVRKYSERSLEELIAGVEDDLAHRGGITRARLQQILELLRSERVAEIQDEEFRRRVLALKETVEGLDKWRRRSEFLSQILGLLGLEIPPQSADDANPPFVVDDAPEDYEGPPPALAPRDVRDGRPPDDGKRKRRGHGPASGRGIDIDSISMSKPKVARPAIRLNATMDTSRDPLLMRLGRQLKALLMEATEWLMKTEDVLGVRTHKAPPGTTLDVHHFFTKDKIRAWLSFTSAEKKEQKQLVLIASAQDKWNPLAEEMFRFLFSRGIKITLYISPTAPLDNIGSLPALKQALAKVHEPLDRAAIERDVYSRKRPTEVEIVTVADLLRHGETSIEAIFLHGAVKEILENDTPEADSARVMSMLEKPPAVKKGPAQDPSEPAVVPTKEKATELSLAEQMARVRDLSIKNLDVRANDDGETFLIDTWGTVDFQPAQLPQLATMTRLKSICFSVARGEPYNLDWVTGLFRLSRFSFLGNMDRVTTLAPLAGVISLRYLLMSSVKPLDLQPLSHSKGLEEVDVPRAVHRHAMSLADIPTLQLAHFHKDQFDDAELAAFFERSPNRENLALSLYDNDYNPVRQVRWPEVQEEMYVLAQRAKRQAVIWSDWFKNMGLEVDKARAEESNGELLISLDLSAFKGDLAMLNLLPFSVPIDLALHGSSEAFDLRRLIGLSTLHAVSLIYCAADHWEAFANLPQVKALNITGSQQVQYQHLKHVQDLWLDFDYPIDPAQLAAVPPDMAMRTIAIVHANQPPFSTEDLRRIFQAYPLLESITWLLGTKFISYERDAILAGETNIPHYQITAAEAALEMVREAYLKEGLLTHGRVLSPYGRQGLAIDLSFESEEAVLKALVAVADIGPEAPIILTVLKVTAVMVKAINTFVNLEVLNVFERMPELIRNVLNRKVRAAPLRINEGGQTPVIPSTDSSSEDLMNQMFDEANLLNNVLTKYGLPSLRPHANARDNTISLNLSHLQLSDKIMTELARCGTERVAEIDFTGSKFSRWSLRYWMNALVTQDPLVLRMVNLKDADHGLSEVKSMLESWQEPRLVIRAHDGTDYAWSADRGFHVAGKDPVPMQRDPERVRHELSILIQELIREGVPATEAPLMVVKSDAVSLRLDRTTLMTALTLLNAIATATEYQFVDELHIQGLDSVHLPLVNRFTHLRLLKLGMPLSEAQRQLLLTTHPNPGLRLEEPGGAYMRSPDGKYALEFRDEAGLEFAAPGSAPSEGRPSPELLFEEQVGQAREMLASFQLPAPHMVADFKEKWFVIDFRGAAIEAPVFDELARRYLSHATRLRMIHFGDNKFWNSTLRYFPNLSVIVGRVHSPDFTYLKGMTLIWGIEGHPDTYRLLQEAAHDAGTQIQFVPLEDAQSKFNVFSILHRWFPSEPDAKPGQWVAEGLRPAALISEASRESLTWLLDQLVDRMAAIRGARALFEDDQRGQFDRVIRTGT